MAKYTVKLLKKEDIADGTMAFHFEKPERFAFKAGQNGDFTLINPPETDDEGNKRTFSIAIAPGEQDIMIATRMRDTAFKRVLKDMPVGTPVELDGPYGNFVLHQTATTPAVFLTGGIGITPVKSIIEHATKEKFPHRIVLFYANKTPQDAAFLSELESLTKETPQFTFVPVMTRVNPQKWDGEIGHINTELLDKYVKDITTPIYYLSGPASMVAVMRQILISAHVNEDNIRTEEFPGY
jgi:ferredoxin-NADP reductase